ncbi:alpha/beta hydrolase [Streptomyces solicathayae]|uniref:Alpha/beta hydrolase n=1 Tax=Streptomyces solicathayae TaxID=3081768 RepID=A0ABZ0LS19_9ACTN|nr:alpha/beta hydrolase [Streptomyces sp. HUAS YS2]WOX22249.1 alpha/beta hydrolase [Streptomyces sp. HUAS YS2]
MLGTVVTTSAALLAAPAAGLLGHRQVRRAALAKRLRVTAPHGIDESGFVRVGGIDQWISVRGDDRSNPVILEIHGGAGASNHVFLPRTRDWERHFTIVRWDMRGAGTTFAHGGPDGQGEFTLDRLERDAVEVTEHVRARLGVERVLLVANSFGTVLGLRLARRHPELYAAYVGTDQNIQAGGRERTAYDGLLSRLERAGKRKELATVLEMGADRTAWSAGRSAAFSKLALTTDPLSAETMKKVVMSSLWFSPLHDLRGLRDYGRAMTFSESLAPEAALVDEWAEGTAFRLPFFVFQGAADVLTPAAAAHRFFVDVTAPVKDFALIEDASHFAAFRRPERFLDLMLTRVRPVVAAG